MRNFSITKEANTFISNSMKSVFRMSDVHVRDAPLMVNRGLLAENYYTLNKKLVKVSQS